MEGRRGEDQEPLIVFFCFWKAKAKQETYSPKSLYEEDSLCLSFQCLMCRSEITERVRSDQAPWGMDVRRERQTEGEQHCNTSLNTVGLSPVSPSSLQTGTAGSGSPAPLSPAPWRTPGMQQFHPNLSDWLRR